MIDKEISEIRRHIRRDRANMMYLYGCYVNDNKDIISTFRQGFGTMPENEADQFFALFKKCLSGSLGKNMIDIAFRTRQVTEGPEHKLLMTLRGSHLKNEEALHEFYRKVAESVTIDGEYLILIGCDDYDVPFKSDAFNSDEVFRYLLCAICPIKRIKPTLEYKTTEKEVHDSAIAQRLSAPVLGFMFPAFDDRSTNIYNALLYSKDAGDNHEAFVSAVFNAMPFTPAEQQKQNFEALLGSSLDDECSLDVIKAVYDDIDAKIQLHKESRVPEPLTISKDDIKFVLQSEGVSEEKIARFSVNYDSVFGFEAEVFAKNLIDQRKFEVKTPDVTIKVSPDRTDLVETRIINGVKYILVCADEDIEASGTRVTIQ